MRIIQGKVTDIDNRRSSTEANYLTNFVLDQKIRVMMQPTIHLSIHHNDHIIVGGFFLGKRFMAMAYHNTSTSEKWQNYPWMMGALGLFLVGFSLYSGFSDENPIDTLVFTLPFALAGIAFLWYAWAISKTFKKVASYENV